ncbi:polysaccharide deacetylase family protein [Ornithinibacillus sp. FSL M8-0202]|uniref:polysaccharide deacetylase family protein n=1 Tax=unclassified Ornithinibacillus TaxID=2620869 RepID=UPI0030D08711
MRIAVFVLSTLVILFLSACSPGHEQIEGSKSDEVVGQTNQKSENEVSELEEEETSNGITKDKEEESNQKSEENTEEIKPQYRVSEDWSVVPIEDGINAKVVLLTIDDAPEKYALQMAKTLQELDAGAIFFVNGHFIDTPQEAEVLKEIHNMGFTIGNHTYSHVNLESIVHDPEKQREEIVRLNDKIEEIIGERPKFFRAPHGINTEDSKKIAKEEKMIVMNWSYGYDYFTPYMDKDKLIEAMVTGEGPEVDVPYSLLKPGANLLMHDREWTNEALRDIVEGLREQGYEIVDPELIETIE